MIRASGRTPEGRPVLYLGLSRENVTRLLDDQPIVLDPNLLALDGPVIVLFGGEDETAMVEALRTATDQVIDWREGTT